MALNYAIGNVQWLAADAATTTYVVTGLGFQPKALKFYCNGLAGAINTSSNNTQAARISVGFATSTSDRQCVCMLDTHDSGSAACSDGYQNDAVLAVVDYTPSFTAMLDLSAIGSDGFTLIVDDQIPANITVFWEAWGGTDITVATTVAIAEPAGTGNVDYTATGFTSAGTDQVVMFAGCQSVSAAGTAEKQDAGLCLGYASGTADANNVVFAGNNDEASGTMDSDRYGTDSECLAMMTIGGGNPSARAKMTSWLTDGFRLNWIARATTNRRYIALAIKGGQWAAGGYSIDDALLNNTATVSGLSFTPIGLSGTTYGSSKSTPGTSQAAPSALSIAGATSTSSRQNMAYTTRDGSGASSVVLSLYYDTYFLMIMASTGGTWCAFDLSSINADGFTAIVDDAGAEFVYCGYLAFASASGPFLPEMNHLYLQAVNRAAVY